MSDAALTATLNRPDGNHPRAETPIWTIDAGRSELRFTARQMGMTVRGRFTDVAGSVDLRLDQLEASRVDATIRTASVEPAMPQLRGLLLSDSFLAADEYPELRFESDLIEPDGDAYVVHGALTFRGERRDVAFHTRLGAVDETPEARIAAIEARADVDGLIGDEDLQVELSLVATTAAIEHEAAGPPDAMGAVLARDDRDADHRPLRLVGIVGSLRRGSLNRALMRAARESVPEGVVIEPFELGDIPFYDGDIEAEGDPAPVRALKAAIRQADGIVIATPEYNRGMPAVTKNAIDWASRPPFGSPLAGKPVLLIGATTGRSATQHALEAAARSLEYTQAVPFPMRFGVAKAAPLVDDEGRWSDAETRQGLSDVLTGFTRFVRTAQQQRAAA